MSASPIFTITKNKSEQNKIQLPPTYIGHTVNNCFINEQVNELIEIVPKQNCDFDCSAIDVSSLRRKWQTSLHKFCVAFNCRIQ